MDTEAPVPTPIITQSDPTHSMPPPSFIIADLDNESEIRDFLNSLTKPKIKDFLKDVCGVRVSNFDRIVKHKLIEHLVSTWTEIMEAKTKKDIKLKTFIYSNRVLSIRIRV